MMSPAPDGRFLGMSVPSKAKWPPDPPRCTCKGERPAYHSPGCPVKDSPSKENRRSGRW